MEEENSFQAGNHDAGQHIDPSFLDGNFGSFDQSTSNCLGMSMEYEMPVYQTIIGSLSEGRYDDYDLGLDSGQSFDSSAFEQQDLTNTTMYNNSFDFQHQSQNSAPFAQESFYADSFQNQAI